MKRLLLVCLLLGCGDDGGGPGGDGGGGGAAPIISMVAWTHEAGCVASSTGDVTVVTTVTDSDTPAGMLTFSGGVAGCSPLPPNGVTSANATITCPNVAPYSGTVRVTDPEGNSDQQAISIEPCVNDSAP